MQVFKGSLSFERRGITRYAQRHYAELETETFSCVALQARSIADLKAALTQASHLLALKFIEATLQGPIAGHEAEVYYHLGGALKAFACQRGDGCESPANKHAADSIRVSL